MANLIHLGHSGDVQSRIERNACVPINRLPSEILSIILLYGYTSVPLEYTSNRKPAYSKRVAFSGTVAAVCSGWRNLALDTSRLWSSISYHPLLHEKQTIETSLQRVQTMLARSSTASLYIALSGIHDVAYICIWNALLPHLYRCRTVKLDFSHVFPTSFFPLPAKLERLEELFVSILLEESPADSVCVQLLEAKGCAPLLRKLYVEDDAYSPWLDLTNAITPQLESLIVDTEGDYDSRLLPISEGNGIQTLCIRTGLVDTWGTSSFPPLPHNAFMSLRSLTVLEGDVHIFYPLTAPLEELTLLCDYPMGIPVATLCVHTIWPTLRSLILVILAEPSAWLENALIASLIVHHPSIESLTVARCRKNSFDSLVKALHKLPITVSLPALRFINLEMLSSESEGVVPTSLNDVFPSVEIAVSIHVCSDPAEECMCNLF